MEMEKVVAKYSPLELLTQSLWGAISRKRTHVVGKVLTIIDATTQDEEQREALKSLVKSAIYEDSLSYVNEIVSQFGKKFAGKLTPDDEFLKKDHSREFMASRSYFPD